MYSNTLEPAHDRILHMSDMCAKMMPKVRAWAQEKEIEHRLNKALEYLRTYSSGPEKEWHSHLHLDMFFNLERPSFTCAVSRRDPDDPENEHKFRLFMLIGMIWHEQDQDWSFHS